MTLHPEISKLLVAFPKLVHNSKAITSQPGLGQLSVLPVPAPYPRAAPTSALPCRPTLHFEAVSVQGQVGRTLLAWTTSVRDESPLLFPLLRHQHTALVQVSPPPNE